MTNEALGKAAKDFKRTYNKNFGLMSEHKKYASLSEAIKANDKQAIADFEKEAKTGGIIRLM